MNDNLLVTQNLSRVYTSQPQEIPAVQSIDLSLNKGDLLAIMGRSGSGKTTLLNLVGGLDRPTTGSIEFQGKELTTLSDHQLSRLRRTEIGFVLQSFTLIPLFSAYENVELPLHILGVSYPERQQRVSQTLKLMGLGHRSNHRPYELSGGEQQRLAMARAIVHRPKLLLADEPTGHLDLPNAVAIFTLLGNMANSEGMTVLVTTHDSMVRQLGYQVQEMVDGSFVIPQTL